MQVASTYDGSALRIYLDGLPSGEALVSGTVCSNAFLLAIGAKHVPTSSEFFFNGTIDEVRLFSRALDPSEVQAEMLPSVPGLGPPGFVLATLVVLLKWRRLRVRGFGPDGRLGGA